jgi:hypothetical protein
LAHAYHDQVLTFDDPDVLAAYKRCVEGDTYPQRDWVKSNHKEFFAGVTTRYFGRKEERDAVGQRDPVLEKFLQKTWGKPKATMDTPGIEPSRGKGKHENTNRHSMFNRGNGRHGLFRHARN